MSGLEGFPKVKHTLELDRRQKWRYQTDEFHGICEIARDDMTVRVTFEAVSEKFYDVLAIDGVIKRTASASFGRATGGAVGRCFP